MTEKELYSIYVFVKKFRHFLGGRKFLVQSDHSALKYITGARDSTGKITRMLNYLQGYDFEIHHIPGTKMEELGPDILSRSMMPISNHPQDILAKKLERPILRLNHGFSPFLGSWFSIEDPKPENFDGNGNIIISNDMLGYELPSEDNSSANSKEEKLYCNLRKMLKNSNTMDGTDHKSEEEQNDMALIPTN